MPLFNAVTEAGKRYRVFMSMNRFVVLVNRTDNECIPGFAYMKIPKKTKAIRNCSRHLVLYGTKAKPTHYSYSSALSQAYSVHFKDGRLFISNDVDPDYFNWLKEHSELIESSFYLNLTQVERDPTYAHFLFSNPIRIHEFADNIESSNVTFVDLPMRMG